MQRLICETKSSGNSPAAGEFRVQAADVVTHNDTAQMYEKNV